MIVPKKQHFLRKAQTPLEIMGISIVLVGLLLVVMLTTYNRNIQTQDLLVTGESSILCQQVSSGISKIYINRASISETVPLTRITLFERAEGNTGILTIENVTCGYIAPVQLSTGEKDTDAGGVTLAVGNWCFEKFDSNVLVTQGACT